MSFTVKSGDVKVIREPLRSPFGFKGGALTELWQVIVRLVTDDGREAIGVGLQSVLWSDSGVFCSRSEEEGNRAMLAVTRHALSLAVGRRFGSPREMLDALVEEAYRYGCLVTGRTDLRRTFALNALVPLDHAAWQLEAAERGSEDITDLCRAPALSCRHSVLASIPLLTYHTGKDEIRRLAEEGVALFKIKVGADPNGDGDRAAMLEWDKARLSEIHAILSQYRTPLTESGHIAYYLDANGRYDSKERLSALLDHAAAIGALPRILILEEPFPEEMEVDVSDLPVRIAADESAHSRRDVERRIALGYGAIALKPAAKTLSVTLDMLEAAAGAGVPCFVADLTVPPQLVEFNKNVAARIAPLPGMLAGVLETNGAQNYCRWGEMVAECPLADMGERGRFTVPAEFFDHGGGAYRPLDCYKKLFD
jgi:L-alanine-DL-glutamate epimerase-like enolase superfamily enzyme